MGQTLWETGSLSCLVDKYVGQERKQMDMAGGKRDKIGKEHENECSDTFWSRESGRGVGGIAFDQRDSCRNGIRNIQHGCESGA